MRRFEAVIWSETAPNLSSLWLKDKKLWFFDGEWIPVEGAFDIEENSDIDKIENLLIGNRSFTGDDSIDIDKEINTIIRTLNTQAPKYNASMQDISNKGNGLIDVINQYMDRQKFYPSIWDKIVFRVGSSQIITTYNRNMIRHIPNIGNKLTSYIPVYLSSSGDSEIHTVPAIYYNMHLYTMLDGKLKVYNINANSSSSNYGAVTLLKTVDLTLLPTYIDLELGNTDEIKAYNLEQLQKVSGTQFFVHADYGIGVGSFISGHGGETTIQTAGGDRVHYIITEQGECKKQEDRFEHSELFFNLGQVDIEVLPNTITIRDSVDISKFKKATNLAFEAYNGETLVDDVSMTQVSVNTLNNQRIYTSPDIICVENQNWNYIKTTATTYNDRVEIYLETV